MLKNFTYEISGIDNVNLVLPKNGNWYYNHLKNGNIKIHGRPTNIGTFSPTIFEQNIQKHGGNIEKGNNLITKKEVNMSNDKNTPKEGNNGDKGQIPIDESAINKEKTATEELKNVEKEIEKFLSSQNDENIADLVANTWVEIQLTTKNEIKDIAGFLKQFTTHLTTKIDKEAQSKIKPLIEKIKKSQKNVKEAIYTQPSCTPEVTSKKITIKEKKTTPATLTITMEETIDGVKVSSTKKYNISASLFSSEVILNALSNFTDGVTFLNGLTEYKETFTPSN